MEKKKILKTNGAPCPVCGEFIVSTIEEISSGKELVCPMCGMKIKVTFETSDKVAEILEKLKNI